MYVGRYPAGNSGTVTFIGHVCVNSTLVCLIEKFNLCIHMYVHAVNQPHVVCIHDIQHPTSCHIFMIPFNVLKPFHVAIQYCACMQWLQQ